MTTRSHDSASDAAQREWDAMYADLNKEVTAGQAVSDWALVRFGKTFSDNKFRDGSWVKD